MEKLLTVKNLCTYFKTAEGTVKAVDGVDFEIGFSETLGLVGESGSGKTLTALSIMKLIPYPGKIISGEILFNDGEKAVDLNKLPDDEMRKIRGAKISMVFQEPFTSLNPVFTVGYQINEVVELHQELKGKIAREKVIESLSLVGIADPDRIINSYPHELSGGMRQRIMIAMALSSNSNLLIADEPTTALDVTIQAQILELISDIKSKLKLSMILITHDLGIVSEVADNVAVMYAGKIVEKASAKEIFENPLHPYTLGLLRSIPDVKNPKGRLYTIEGSIPDPVNLPNGCRFNPRCPDVMDKCKEKEPPETELNGGRMVRCFKYDK